MFPISEGMGPTKEFRSKSLYINYIYLIIIFIYYYSIIIIR